MKCPRHVSTFHQVATSFIAFFSGLVFPVKFRAVKCFVGNQSRPRLTTQLLDGFILRISTIKICLIGHSAGQHTELYFTSCFV